VEHQRQGRKVTALKFKIRRVTKLPGVDGEQSSLFPDLDDMPVAVKMLQEAGLSADEAWRIWQQGFHYVDAGKRPAEDMGDDTDAAFTWYIREKVDLLKRQEQGKVKSATGFLLKAIRENWANPDFAKRKKKAAERRAFVAKDEQRKQLEQEKAQLEGACSDACEGVYEAILQDNPDALAGLIKAALEANPFLRRYCEGETPEAQYRQSMAVAGAVHTLMKERYPDRFKVINDEHQPRLDALDAQIAALG
jgi:DNA-binding transcriptional MerR regulator